MRAVYSVIAQTWMLGVLVCPLQMYAAWLISHEKWTTSIFTQKKLRQETSGYRVSSEYINVYLWDHRKGYLLQILIRATENQDHSRFCLAERSLNLKI
jgi:hypothetical protein